MSGKYKDKKGRSAFDPTIIICKMSLLSSRFEKNNNLFSSDYFDTMIENAENIDPTKMIFLYVPVENNEKVYNLK